MKLFRSSGWIAAGFVGAVLSAASGTARADGLSATLPMIEVGTGIESALSEGGVNVLLRVGFGLSRSPQDSEPDPVFGAEQLVWAHITGEMAVDFASRGAEALPYLNFTFIPVHNALEIIRENGDSVMGDLQILPVNVSRDIRLDQNVGVKVSVVGLELGAARVIDEKVAVFAQLAADALGYKMVDFVSQQGTFNGFRFIGGAIEGGAAFFLNQTVTLRVLLGGSADVNFGTSKGMGGAVQSDLRAYLAVRADIARFIQVFFRVGYGGNCLSGGFGCNGAPQLMLGAAFLF